MSSHKFLHASSLQVHDKKPVLSFQPIQDTRLTFALLSQGTSFMDFKKEHNQRLSEELIICITDDDSIYRLSTTETPMNLR